MSAWNGFGQACTSRGRQCASPPLGEADLSVIEERRGADGDSVSPEPRVAGADADRGQWGKQDSAKYTIVQLVFPLGSELGSPEKCGCNVGTKHSRRQMCGSMMSPNHLERSGSAYLPNYVRLNTNVFVLTNCFVDWCSIEAMHDFEEMSRVGCRRLPYYRRCRFPLNLMPSQQVKRLIQTQSVHTQVLII